MIDFLRASRSLKGGGKNSIGKGRPNNLGGFLVSF